MRQTSRKSRMYVRTSTGLQVIITLLLQYLSSSYQNIAPKYFHFLQNEFLNSDWLEIFIETNFKLQTIISEISQSQFNCTFQG